MELTKREGESIGLSKPNPSHLRPFQVLHPGRFCPLPLNPEDGLHFVMHCRMRSGLLSGSSPAVVEGAWSGSRSQSETVNFMAYMRVTEGEELKSKAVHYLETLLCLDSLYNESDHMRMM